MDTVISYFSEYSFLDLFALIAMLIVCVRGIERGFKWCAEKLRAYYKRMRGIEEKNDTLEGHTQEIKELTARIDRFVSTVEHHYNAIMEKVDEQQQRLEVIDKEGKKRDCAVLRDRILGGMRFFSQNTDEKGKVHISVSDHENMEHLFDEYFSCGGNGTVQQLYKNEFKHFIIDR